MTGKELQQLQTNRFAKYTVVYTFDNGHCITKGFDTKTEAKEIFYKLNDCYKYEILNDDNDDTSYESELVADTSNYDGEWQPYRSNNRW